MIYNLALSYLSYCVSLSPTTWTLTSSFAELFTIPFILLVFIYLCAFPLPEMPLPSTSLSFETLLMDCAYLCPSKIYVLKPDAQDDRLGGRAIGR